MREDLAAYHAEWHVLHETGRWTAMTDEDRQAILDYGDVLRAEYEALCAQFAVTREHYLASRESGL